MTPAMREAVEALEKAGGNKTQAARALGLSRSALRDRIEGAQRWEKAPQGQKDAVQNAGLDFSVAKAGWRKVKNEDGTADSVYWSAKESDINDDIVERIKAAFEDIQPAKPVAAPLHANEDLMTIYPIADAHIGMMAWGRETGEAYNTNIAVDRLKDWLGRCIAASPSSKRAVILDVGDLTHADDQNNQTPKSKHILDVDSRHFRTLDTTIAALGHVTELALTRHEEVTVIILPGNHNPHSYMAILFAMYERYRNEPRVIVRKEPGEFWVEEFGVNMMAAHHGDKATPQRLALALADEHADIWGRTKHRVLWTGHRHHLETKEIGGLVWEQLRALTAKDAYAVSHAYTARAQLQAITLHREQGEVSRCKVNG